MAAMNKYQSVVSAPQFTTSWSNSADLPQTLRSADAVSS